MLGNWLGRQSQKSCGISVALAVPPPHQIQEATLEGTGLSNSVLACGGVLTELGTVQMFLAVCLSAQAVNVNLSFS